MTPKEECCLPSSPKTKLDPTKAYASMRFTASPAAARARSPASKRSTKTAKIHCRPSPQAAVRQRIAFRSVDSNQANVRITARPSNPVNRPKALSLLQEFEPVRKKLLEGVVIPAGFPAQNHGRFRLGEFAQHLQARSARGTRRIVQVRDRAGNHSHLGTEFRHRANDSRALRADGQPIGSIFDVRPGYQFPVVE